MPTDARDLADLAALALDAARAAGETTLAYFDRPIAVEAKADASPVTEADRRAEDVLRERIVAACPDDAIVGEEHGAVEGTSGRTWTLDPIDGTVAFVHGVPLYTVLVGLLEGGRSILGVVHLPSLGESVVAWSGGGCHWHRRGEDPRPARVTATDRLDRALVLSTDWSRLPAMGLGPARDRIEAAAGRLRGWGDAWGHVLVATGRADAMLDPKMATWDSAPLQPVVEEAGGRFSTWDGRPDPAGGSAVSTNGRLHAAVLEAITPPAAI